jgi:hypothetical protein
MMVRGPYLVRLAFHSFPACQDEEADETGEAPGEYYQEPRPRDRCRMYANAPQSHQSHRPMPSKQAGPEGWPGSRAELTRVDLTRMEHPASPAVSPETNIRIYRMTIHQWPGLEYRWSQQYTGRCSSIALVYGSGTDRPTFLYRRRVRSCGCMRASHRTPRSLSVDTRI